MTISDNPKRLTESDILFVRAFSECKMSIRCTACQMNCSTQNVKYHLKKVHELTDCDPLNDDDLARLIDWINETDQT